MIKTRPTTIRSVIGWLASSGCSSLLDRGEQDWRAACPAYAARSQHPVALLTYAHRKVTALAEGEGWDSEYPRDTWHLRRLGIDSQCATLQFGGIPQPWLLSAEDAAAKRLADMASDEAVDRMIADAQEAGIPL